MTIRSVAVTTLDGKEEVYKIESITKLFDGKCKRLSAQDLITILKKGDDVVLLVNQESGVATAFRPGDSVMFTTSGVKFCW